MALADHKPARKRGHLEHVITTLDAEDQATQRQQGGHADEHREPGTAGGAGRVDARGRRGPRDADPQRAAQGDGEHHDHDLHQREQRGGAQVEGADDLLVDRRLQGAQPAAPDHEDDAEALPARVRRDVEVGRGESARLVLVGQRPEELRRSQDPLGQPGQRPHRRSAALSGSCTVGSPDQSVTWKKKSARCSIGPSRLVRCTVVSGAAVSTRTPSSSPTSRCSASLGALASSTWPAAPQAHQPSMNPVPCRSWRSTSVPEAPLRVITA